MGIKSLMMAGSLLIAGIMSVAEDRVSIEPTEKSIATLATNAADASSDLEQKLSPGGRAVLARLIGGYPKLDEAKIIKEFNDKNDTEVKFSREKMKEVQQQAGKLFPYFKVGELITIETRKKQYTGDFGGMVGEKLKVGAELITPTDVSQDILDRANSARMIENQQQYIMENYINPKKAYAAKFKKNQDAYVKEQKIKMVNQVIIEKKLLDQYPLLEQSPPLDEEPLSGLVFPAKPPRVSPGVLKVHPSTAVEPAGIIQENM